MEKDLIKLWLVFGASFATYYAYLKYQENSKKRNLLATMKSHPNIKEISKMNFNSYELDILFNLVLPEQNHTTFDDIGGLEDVVQDLKDTIFLPLEASKQFNSGNNKGLGGGSNDLFAIPKGILLYGPPGTGKTMLAKAIAHHCDYNFLTIDHSILDNKWFGETEKMISAMFSVAKKIQPTIIFIDEIDSMTATRSGTEQEVSTSKKSMLLQLWDGFNNTNDDKVIIMGATNRPNSIDPAFLRRLPKCIKIDLPNVHQRKHILKIILKPYVNSDFNFDKLAAHTIGYSGSDLKELCKSASNIVLRNQINNNKDGNNNNGEQLKIKFEDFEKVLKSKGTAQKQFQ